MEVVQKAIGSEGNLDVKVEGGKIVLSITHVHASGQVSIIASEDLKYFLELLKGKLPAGIQFIIPVAEATLP